MSDNLHQPVLLNEVLSYLALKPQGLYIDATFGRGGHARAILGQLGPQGRLIMIDQDLEAIAYAKHTFGTDPRVTIIHDSFANLEQITQNLGITGQVDGLLLDLGVSSPQLDEAERGFSFMRDGPLDMRMNIEQGISVAEWLKEVSLTELSDILYLYGEERFSRRIARLIGEYRMTTPITRTHQLAELVAKAVPIREKGKNPATRTFQALRIYINDELGALKRVLPAIPAVLASGGRVAIISFHSLEDRLVKHFFIEMEKGRALPKEIPIMITDAYVPVLKRVSKAVHASKEECDRNSRARSAVMRVAEK